MNTQPRDTVHAEASFREAQPGELLGDLMRFGPAPRASREAFVSLVSIALLVVVLVALAPEPVVAVVVVGVVAVYLAARWVVGARVWSRS